MIRRHPANTGRRPGLNARREAGVRVVGYATPQGRSQVTDVDEAINTMKSVLLVALLNIAVVAHAEPPKPDVSDALNSIKERLKPFVVSEHNLAEMRDGFLAGRTLTKRKRVMSMMFLRLRKHSTNHLLRCFLLGNWLPKCAYPKMQI
jgi:hypothetical protein